jgi:hypothetical protein
MKKVLGYALVLLAIVAATGIDAQMFLGRETLIAYYYDDTFVTYIGQNDRYCDQSTYVWGSIGSWRVYDQYSCSTGARVVHRCQQTNGTGGWITLSVCPPNQP